MQVDVGFRDHGNPFPTEAELEAFTKNHIKKLSNKIIKKIEAQNVFAKNEGGFKNIKGDHLRKDHRPRTVLLRSKMKSSVKISKDNETTLDASKINISHSHKRTPKTLQRMASRDGSEQSEVLFSRRKRKPSVTIPAKKLSPDLNRRHKEARKTEPVMNARDFRTYLEKRTITDM